MDYKPTCKPNLPHQRATLELRLDRRLSRFLNYLLTDRQLKLATIRRKLKAIKSLLKHGVDINNPDFFSIPNTR